MVLIKWDNSLSVGVKVIDSQHKHLIDLINQLNDSIGSGVTKDIVKEVLDEMTEYTITHFGTEEKYFDEFGYERTKEHKEEHKGFVDKVNSFKKDFELFESSFTESNLYMAKEMMNFLKNWLVNHIKISDKKYAKGFNEHGLT